MKKFTKLLLAGALVFSAGSAAVIGLVSLNGKEATPVCATVVVQNLEVGGYSFAYVDRDLHSTDFDPTDYSWDYYSSGKLVIKDYTGPEILISCDLDSRADLFVDVSGECVISASNESSKGIHFVNNGLGYMYGTIEFIDERSSLTIDGGNYGVQSSCSNTTGVTSLLIQGHGYGAQTQNKLIINGANYGIQSERLIISENVDVYINAIKTGISAGTIRSKELSDGEWYPIANICMTDSTSSLTVIAKEERAFYMCYDPQHTAFNECGFLAVKYDDAHIFLSNDQKVFHVANENKYLEGFLQFTDLSGNIRASRNSTINVNVGETKELGFNNISLPSQLTGYTVERTLDYKKKGETESIYNVSNQLTTNLSYNVSPTDVDFYSYKETLKLKKNGDTYAQTSGTLTISPITIHAISTDISGLKFVSNANPDFKVRTGETFKFQVEIEEYYKADHVSLYADGNLIGEINGTYSTTTFTIENVRKDLVIYSDKSLDYSTTYKVYAGYALVDQGIITKGTYYTLPTLTVAQGLNNFAYWKVGNRTNHYSAGQQITFTEAERGEIRIEAHYENSYNLTIVDGHFYSDSACTQEIARAQHNTTVYFKFDSELDVIVDGKTLYSYDIECESSGVIAYDMGGYWEMDVPANDVLITPIYKYVVNEVTAENVAVPVAGEPLIENAIKAPEDANYLIQDSSKLCYKRIDSSTRTLVNTYDINNPYIFENDATYEFEFQFRIPSSANYLLHPDGYLRDSGCQITIDGLNDSDYEIVSANFTNSYKEYYKVILRMTAVNQYAVNVTSGTASINGKTVSLAPAGATVLLSANVAPTGKAFDKWEVTGVSVDEASLNGSKLSFEMPSNAVSATATYKDVSYFAVSFNANGGTGTIDDDISYGEFVLPMCTFTAPEHKHFKAWDVNGTEYAELANIIVTANIEVKAIWAADEHTISFNANGGTGTMSSVTKDYGSSYTLPENGFTSPAHKHFVGWALSASGSVITGSSIEITGDVELFAIWATDTHTITFACTGGATGTMDPVVKEYNDTYVLPTPTFVANDGKEFKYWTIDGVKVTESSITITGDVTLTAVYGDITVDPVVLNSITLSGTYPTTFEVGDTFSYEGLVVTAHYSDSTSAVVTGFTVSSPDMSTAGSKTVTVSYTEGGVTKTATYQITVNEKSVTPPIDPETPEQPSKGLPAGAVVGIVIGSVLVASIGGFALVWFVIKKKTWADFVALFKKK